MFVEVCYHDDTSANDKHFMESFCRFETLFKLSQIACIVGS